MPSFHTYKDRTEGGRALIEILKEFKNTNAIVLALPRGGVILGREVAKALELPLDVIITRKICIPHSPEYAVGAIDIDGTGIFHERESGMIDKEWLLNEIKTKQEEARRRYFLYREGREPLVLNGKTAILVDDGMATGMTMHAAAHYAKKLGAERIIAAAPVASASALNELEGEAELRTLQTPEPFFAVGQFYEDFPQVTDKEVIASLTRHASN